MSLSNIARGRSWERRYDADFIDICTSASQRGIGDGILIAGDKIRVVVNALFVFQK
jgi:hypothetical protein